MEESSIAAWILKPIDETIAAGAAKLSPPPQHSIANNTTKGPSVEKGNVGSNGSEHDHEVPVSGQDIFTAAAAAVAGIAAALSKSEQGPEQQTADGELMMSEDKEEEEAQRPIFFIDTDDDADNYGDEQKDDVGEEKEEKNEVKAEDTERDVPMELDGEKQTTEAVEENCMPLVDYLCALNACSLKELKQLLYNVKARKHMVNHLQTFCLLRTAHLRERNQSLRCDDLSTESAHDTYACGGYLDLTVRQYFFAKHGIKLKHPCMPCLVEYGGGKHESYYPLEVVKVVVEPPPPRRWMRVPPMCEAGGAAVTAPTLKRVRRLVSYWPSEADDRALEAIAKGEATLLNPSESQLKIQQEREREKQLQAGGSKNTTPRDSKSGGIQSRLRHHRPSTANACHVCCAAPSPLNRW